MSETEGLDLSFEKLMVFENMSGSNSGGGMVGGLGGGLRITEWKDIPVELLLRILSLVDDQTVIVASGVCHGWRDAISWGLTHLSLSWCKKNMNNLVLSLAPKFTKLQGLVLRQDTPQLQDDGVEKIAAHCRELQELDLSKSFRLTDRSLYALAHGCPELVKLNISGCPAFSDTALGYLTGFCRKLKFLNLCGCVRTATDRALKAIGYNCHQLQSLNLGWCDRVSDEGVKSLAYGCPDLRALDLCGCVLITDESVVPLANNCLHLRSLGLYYCKNITDRAMYSLAQSRVRNKHEVWASVKSRYEEEGLTNLNISQCTALTPPAVQALCDSFPALHTCPGRHSLIISGCLNLTSVHCACAFQAHRDTPAVPHLAH
ncbi:F-box/RNI-like superfamily protein [Perilla frutescens var. hirtella]|uniref:F-box/RNI-like superfamily protein n=1 Tax=Perilla frutescens var. hirtella TaxID=608512 RepID=A0AAD4JLK3_PERFH|nr:F-box/RNI-like superfamily protein [Perilla frutescens var. frutescens]KAH6800066.1 F-box/RNI-like superfamily protein [Perilla frutescens var. hirtella]KAH6836047.1 F-box/RNI-like superfamily protein [Perilla frutescens var. hirtella]